MSNNKEKTPSYSKSIEILVAEKWRVNNKAVKNEERNPNFFKSQEKNMQWEKQVEDPTTNHQILVDIRLYLKIGYWTGLIPVQGIFSNDPSAFRWRALNTLCIVSAFLVFLVLTLKRVLHMITDVSMGAVDSLSYTFSPVYWSFFFLRQAQKFSSLMKEWTEVDQKLMLIGACPRLKMSLNAFTYAYLASYFGIVISMHLMHLNPVSSDISSIIQAIITLWTNSLSHESVDPSIKDIPDYLLVHIYFNLIWNYAELTFIIFTYSLYKRFKMYNNYLELFKNKNTSNQFWVQMRLLFSSLAKLTRSLDNVLSPSTCLIFFIEVFFICLMLLEALSSPEDMFALYIMVIVSMVRLFVMALIAADLHDLGKQPLTVLFSVPSESFCEEVLRFQLEVISNDVALTGCQFFTITRSFIMTIIGTIFTFEVVLLQFGSARTTSPLNISLSCLGNTTLH